MNGEEDTNLAEIDSFEWDEGNLTKSTMKHGVEPKECEEVFDNEPIYAQDSKHSEREKRYIAYGITNRKRFLFIVFTVRQNQIRIISARSQSRRERRFYEKVKVYTKI